MALYISNCTTQNFVFNYREPVNKLLRHVRIPDGGQVVIGEGWTAQQQQQVIEQLEVFGGRDAAEVYGKMEKFTGIVYRDCGVISEEEIRLGHDSELKTREERSVAEATKAALGFDRAVRRRSREHPAARETEVEVAQELPRGQRPKGDEVKFSLSVTPEGRGDVKLPVA